MDHDQYEDRGGWLNIMSHGCEAWPPEDVSAAVKRSFAWLKDLDAAAAKK